MYQKQKKRGGCRDGLGGGGGGLAVTSQDPPRLVKTSVQALLLMEAKHPRKQSIPYA